MNLENLFKMADTLNKQNALREAGEKAASIAFAVFS